MFDGVSQPLTYAQTLRVIGQELSKFRLDSFSLEKVGDEYVARIAHAETPRTLLTQIELIKGIITKALGFEHPVKESPNVVRFTTMQIVWADTQNRFKRYDSNGMPLQNLSVILRALGDYLDRKKAAEFAIWWSTHSAKLRYDQKEEYFTTNNLHDLGISMYLKRMTRSS